MKSAAILGRLTSELDKMAREHVERSQADYLEYGVAAWFYITSAAGR